MQGTNCHGYQRSHPGTNQLQIPRESYRFALQAQEVVLSSQPVPKRPLSWRSPHQDIWTHNQHVPQPFLDSFKPLADISLFSLAVKGFRARELQWQSTIRGAVLGNSLLTPAWGLAVFLKIAGDHPSKAPAGTAL